MFCPKCGKEINDNSAFCQFCGNKLTEGSLSSTTPMTTASKGDVMIKFPAPDFKRLSYVRNSCKVEIKGSKPLKGKLGQVVSFSCEKETAIVVKVGGCGKAVKLSVKPNEKYVCTISGAIFDHLAVSKVDMII